MMKILSRTKWKWLEILNNGKTGERLYLLALVVFLIGDTLSTTMFQVPGSIYTLCKLFACFLLGLKIFLCDEFKKRTLYIVILLLGDAILVYAFSGYMEVIFWVLFLISAQKVSFRKILQVYLIVTISIVVLAFGASMLQVIENLQYVRGGSKRVRNSFGAIYTTDFASHIFMITMSAFYLCRNKLKTWHFALAAIIGGLVYWFCNTRLDMGCLFIMLICFWAIRQKTEKWGETHIFNTGKIKKILICSMPIAAFFMFVASYLYRPGNAILLALDSFMSTRLQLGHKGLIKYGVTLFGQPVKMVGNGGTTEVASNYFFVDCSYLYIFLRYGLLFMLIAITVYVLCSKKYRDDPYFVAVIVLISVNCMIAHHIIELTYNPFALALFAAMPEYEKRDNRSNISKWSRLNLLK